MNEKSPPVTPCCALYHVKKTIHFKFTRTVRYCNTV